MGSKMTLREAAQQALEALEWISDVYVGDDDDAGECASCRERSYKPHAPDCKKANSIAALRAALAEPVQEPIGYLWPTGRHPEFRFTQQKRDGVEGTPLYTAPPQRKPLTVKDKMYLARNWFAEDWAIKQAIGLLEDYDASMDRGLLAIDALRERLGEKT
jgi:hypothetical protein